jgi:hypothetical protein
MEAELPDCPRCGTGPVTPIVYGFPEPDSFDPAALEHIDYRGCVLPDGPVPIAHCRACGDLVRDDFPEVAVD